MIRKLLRRVERIFYSRQAYKFFIKNWVELKDLKVCADVVGTMRFSQNLEPLEMDCPVGRNIVVVAPHPDDEILGAGGTIIKSIAAGKRVKTVYLTSGKSDQPTEQEARIVADRLGYSIEFLRFPLGNIPIDDESLKRCSDAIASFSPDTLFIPFLFDDHDDHRRANQLLLALFQGDVLNGNSFEVWGYQVYTALLPNVLVDITSQAEAKGDAVRTWKSQMKSRDWAHYILGLNAFNYRFLRKGPQPCFAEGFFVVPASEYRNLCEVYFRNPGQVYYGSGYKGLG